jgi:hypothetical protein
MEQSLFEKLLGDNLEIRHPRLLWNSKVTYLPYKSAAEILKNISYSIVVSLKSGVTVPSLGSQDVELPLVSCPRVLSQYIGSYHSYLEAACCVRNLSSHSVLITRTNLTETHRGEERNKDPKKQSVTKLGCRII